MFFGKICINLKMLYFTEIKLPKKNNLFSVKFYKKWQYNSYNGSRYIYSLNLATLSAIFSFSCSL